MENLKIFENEEFGRIRTVIIDEEPWFVGKDVAESLKYQNGSRDINRHIEENDRKKVMIFDGKQNKETIIINESGLYSLILSSKLPSAKKFKHWVTSEILPSIRKHGAYMTEQTLEKALTSPDFLIQLATQLKEEQQARKLAEQKIEEQKPLVTFANTVANSSDSIDMNEMAKLCKKEGINIGRNRLFEILRTKKILMSNNNPYQKYLENEWFEVIETTKNTSYGIKLFTKTLVKGKGQIKIVEMLKEEYN